MSMTVSGSQRDGSGLPDDDASDRREFARIAAALEETGLGRRFLADHAHRHRSADTAVLLQAIARLETIVAQETVRHDARGGAARDRVRADARAADFEDDRADDRTLPDSPAALDALAAIVADLRTEVATGRDDAGAPEPFEAMVQAGGRETSAILAATEAMQEAAWQLRETGAPEALCDVLDRRATAIHTACAAQDRVTQASLGIARTLSLLEARLAAMGAQRTATEAAPTPAPPSPLPSEPMLAPAPAAEDPTDEPAAGDALASAFADLDRLSIEEKIALFS